MLNPLRRCDFVSVVRTWSCVLSALGVFLGVLFCPSGGGAFVGGNGRIAFTVWYSPGIWTVKPDGTGRQQLTSDRSDRAGRWSPDGRAIVFERGGPVDPGDTGIPKIYTKAIGGGPATRLTRGYDLEPAWSPDAKRIVFTRWLRSSRELFVIRADGRGLTRLMTTPDIDEQEPVWSPGGGWIAFAGQADSGPWAIYKVRPNGRDLTELVRGTTGEVSTPSWSPSGAQLAFEEDFRIYTMNADGSDVRPVTAGRDILPVWSPNGGQIAFTRLLHNSAFGEVHDLFSVRPDGTGLRRITKTTRRPEFIWDWQPVCTVRGSRAGETLIGTAGRDLICAGAGNDRIHARAGNDVVFAGAGNDRISGGEGQDILVGGLGSDVCFGDVSDRRTSCSSVSAR